MSTDHATTRPTKADIETLARSLVQRRVDSADKAITSAAEVADIREQLRAAEKQYQRDYNNALDNSWTPKELASLGITAPTNQRKRARPRTRPSNGVGSAAETEKTASSADQ